ncbi:HalOD1 output domain-containing protein [Halomarina halobia]|uniref:HalOD1 output domain-containing protein n=1 Tax=Halomarina halobia TaxID=3033386 RepID=A0ABD6A9J3_9EURY|nr:HalOD1 output domain-containing protein [Halomarina sp. PSR21]
MSQGTGSGDDIGPSDREALNRARYDATDAGSLLATVTVAISEVLDEDPMLLEPPLASVAEWDALEQLLTTQSSETPVIDYVAFSYRGLEIVVHGDGDVFIYDGE